MSNTHREFRATNTDRGCVMDAQGVVYFGRFEGAAFVPSHRKAARAYRTEATAQRAIAQWIGQ